MTKSGMFKKMIAVAMAAAMAAAAMPAAFAGESTEISTAAAADTTDILSGGLRFSQRDLAFYDYDVPVWRARTALPEKYDLRDLGGTSCVTPVRDQSPWGSCWSFSTLASAESNIMKNSENTLPDLSERHLAWFAYQPVASGSQTGEGVSVIKDECDALDQGGNSLKAAALLSAWEGAALEEDVPYQDNAGTLDKTGDWSVAEEKRFDSAAHLLNADFLPGPATLEESQAGDTSGYNAASALAIKKALTENGIVNIAYHADVSKPGESGNSKYFNYENWSQYTYEYIGSGADNTVPNHGVSIVGWDDSYDKSNFGSDGTGQPPQNGAWIIKNSWGYTTAPDSEGSKGWGLVDPATGGHTGYFYLSYYDKTICMPTSFEMDTADGGYRYDNNYQYDYLGLSSTAELAAAVKASVANIFTANGYEELRAVSAVTENELASVTTKVYLLSPETDDPTDGQLVASNVSSYVYAGFHTIELDQPVKLSKGDRFSVVQTIKSQTEDDLYYLPIEAGLTGKEAGSDRDGHGVADAIAYTAKVNAGESYIYNEADGWMDMADAPLSSLSGFEFGNVMIKAFTKNAEVSVPTLETLQVTSYDKNGEQIGETNEVAPSEKGASIVLPSFTDHVIIIPVMSDGNNNAEIKIEGRTYAVNEDIPRSALKTGAKLVVTSLTEPEGYKGNAYVYLVDAIDDTVLSDGGVTLVDSEGYIPYGSTFSAEQVAGGDEYTAVSTALKAESRQDKFTLLRVATRFNGEELALGNGEGVTLRFTLPDGYDAAKTQLYRVEINDGKAKLVAVTADENEALALNTSFINSYYVLAEKSDAAGIKPTTPSGGEEQPTGNGSGSQGQNTNNDGKGTAQTGDTVLPIVWAALFLLLSGMAVVAALKRRANAQQ